jgi:hypothetical protein
MKDWLLGEKQVLKSVLYGFLFTVFSDFVSKEYHLCDWHSFA